MWSGQMILAPPEGDGPLGVSTAGQHFSLRQLGICEPPPPRRGLAFCSDVGLPHRGFSVGAAPDVDADGQAVMSPERAMRLWGRGGVAKSSGRSSCLSSRSNSVLTLTDTEHENKSDSDNGRTTMQVYFYVSLFYFVSFYFVLLIFQLFPNWNSALFFFLAKWVRKQWAKWNKRYKLICILSRIFILLNFIQ